MSATENSWPWVVPPELGSAEADGDTLARAAARVFSGADGRVGAVAQLRHLEGQRQLVRHVLALAERGRA